MNLFGSILIIGGNANQRQKTVDKILSDGDVTTKNNPDLLEITKKADKKTIGIAQAKEIVDFFVTKPFAISKKVAIIKDAQFLTNEAQNALLKTLEELPEWGSIILETETKQDLLETVVSRCRILYTSDLIATDNSEMFNELDDRVESFLNMNVTQAFDFAEELSKETDEYVIEFLKNTAKIAVRAFTNRQGTQIAYKCLETAQKLRNSNLNTKLALENLVLNINYF